MRCTRMRRRRRRLSMRPAGSPFRCATSSQRLTRPILDTRRSSGRVRWVSTPFRRSSTTTRCCSSTRSGDARSYLWVVSAREIRAFTLAPRAEIETLARRVLRTTCAIAWHVSAAGSRGASADDDRRALSRLVIEPAASLLGERRLVLVLPGALSLVPFGTLLDAGAGARSSREHEIVQIPSATTLGAMRALTAGRSRADKDGGGVCRSRSSMRRIRASGTCRPPSASKPAPSEPRAAGLSADPPAVLAERSAGRSPSLAPESVTVFLGFEATRERAVGRALVRLPLHPLRHARRRQPDGAEPFERRLVAGRSGRAPARRIRDAAGRLRHDAQRRRRRAERLPDGAREST